MFRLPQGSLLQSDSGSEGSSTQPKKWVRPEDWLAVPDISNEPNKIIGLSSISRLKNKLAFIIGGGNFTIDWGDGITENFGDGSVGEITVEHMYDFYALSSENMLGPHKQAIVTITMGDGFSLTKYASTREFYPNGEVDLIELTFNTPQLTSLSCEYESSLKSVKLLSAISGSLNKAFSNCYNIEFVDLKNTESVSNFEYCFSRCYVLKANNIVGLNTINANDLSNIFLSSGIDRIPDGFIAGDSHPDLTSSFKDCANLIDLGSADLSKAGTLYNTFQDCTSLSEAHISLNNISISQVRGCFTGCTSLVKATISGASSIYDFRGAFEECRSLTQINIDQLRSKAEGGVNIDDIIKGCRNLSIFPFELFQSARTILETTSLTTPNYFFRDCRELKIPSQTIIPAIFKDGSYLFYQSELSELPMIETGHFTNWHRAFYLCRCVQEIPAYDASGGTDFDYAFTSCISLKRILMTNIGASIDISSTQLDSEAIEVLFTNLKDLTGLPSESVTITGVPAVPNLTQAQKDIAINKNWTIVE